jgi:hypothetical protein
VADAEERTYTYRFAESLREIGILVLVFGPLYALYDGKDGSPNWYVICSWISIGFTLLAFGMYIELSFRKHLNGRRYMALIAVAGAALLVIVGAVIAGVMESKMKSKTDHMQQSTGGALRPGSASIHP